MKWMTALGGASAALLIAGALLHTLSRPAPRERDAPTALDYRRGRQPVVGLADADVLRKQYETWKRVVEDPGHIDLFPSSMIDAPAATKGWVRIYPSDDLIVSEIYGLLDGDVDLWLVDNVDAPGSTIAAERTDAAVYVGTYSYGDGVAHLRAEVEDLVDGEFFVNRVVVTPLGRRPHEGGLFYGAPSLFQRLHALEERMAREAKANTARLLSLAVVAQSGGVPTGFPEIFQDLVTEGEDLFFNETFDGNGRTCGTCHFATNNFTIEAETIATLPPDDPLFLAEFSPPHIFGHPQNLDEDGNPRRFENPALMRAFGLVVENLDGFGDPAKRFTMRGVPHNIGMRVSVKRPEGSIGFPEGPDERTGWSGDGAPFGEVGCLNDDFPKVTAASPLLGVRGTTRDFAVGAIIQHFPRTLDRDFCPPDPDFRLPTADELDAFRAFLFGLGRQVDLELAAGAINELILSDELAEKGKVLFRDPEVSGNVITCNACHENAGANIDDQNFNFDTNVEEFIQKRLDDPEFTVVGEPRPVDGGFGLNPDGNFEELIPQPGFENEAFGDGTFNTVSLVEAADSEPFFHPNSAFTLEQSIEFYASDEFAENFPRIEFEPEELQAVAAFLRAINALDNIENLAMPRAKKAIAAFHAPSPGADSRDDVVNFLLLVAIADATDAVDVLEASGVNSSGGLNANAPRQIRLGINFLRQAQNRNLPDAVRIQKIETAIQRFKRAVDIVRVNP